MGISKVNPEKTMVKHKSIYPHLTEPKKCYTSTSNWMKTRHWFPQEGYFPKMNESFQQNFHQSLLFLSSCLIKDDMAQLPRTILGVIFYNLFFLNPYIPDTGSCQFYFLESWTPSSLLCWFYHYLNWALMTFCGDHWNYTLISLPTIILPFYLFFWWPDWFEKNIHILPDQCQDYIL